MEVSNTVEKLPIIKSLHDAVRVNTSVKVYAVSQFPNALLKFLQIMINMSSPQSQPPRRFRSGPAVTGEKRFGK
jgi:hypothetical protein